MPCSMLSGPGFQMVASNVNRQIVDVAFVSRHDERELRHIFFQLFKSSFLLNGLLVFGLCRQIDLAASIFSVDVRVRCAAIAAEGSGRSIHFETKARSAMVFVL